MNTTGGMSAYRAPTLKVFGSVVELTASGSKIGKEGKGQQSIGDTRKP
ncbi:hypothetical protein Rumeso_03386 [Rubellimicrobium mesophilum DSM 19309]|uniref:Lasso RiPP family leader peptide-containing protein n=1 Tax=Rubellimicrobium mesophilum DSM 19309 TaxID=442562 RepID=A0A017HLQ3_9RHOB|nr:hypothetical protein Rumeso_03386 [Rubellimicrobium mesophilum DSM 19309]